MKAMILAAGRGARMGALTDHLPKPLLCVRGKPLIVYHLEALAKAGIKDVIINLAYLGNKIRDYVGDGSVWELQVCYSEEPEPLETAGAIAYALDFLGDEPFLLINADVFTDLRFIDFINLGLKKEEAGHLLLVPNPNFKPTGDFSISASGKLAALGESQGYTFSGISLLRPGLIAGYAKRRQVFPLLEVFLDALACNALGASVYQGFWRDVGTPERLSELS